MQPMDPRSIWAKYPFEVWFTYNDIRRFRACKDAAERDAAIDMLNATDGVTEVDVIDRTPE